MATRTVKARVELDGEKEYKQALSELNAGNRTLGSEMRKLQAEYKGNTESVEFLTKKGELLERQLLQQKDKVETLRKAVQDSAEKFGESDKRTQEWIKDLNNAEAAEFAESMLCLDARAFCNTQRSQRAQSHAPERRSSVF